MTREHEAHHALAARRWRIAIVLTLTVMVIYFGFIALIAFQKPLMGSLVTSGLSVGISVKVFKNASRSLQ